MRRINMEAVIEDGKIHMFITTITAGKEHRYYMGQRTAPEKMTPEDYAKTITTYFKKLGMGGMVSGNTRNISVWIEDGDNLIRKRWRKWVK